MSKNESEGEVTPAEVEAEQMPMLPYELRINNSFTHYRRLDDGVMVLCFTPGVPGQMPGQTMLMPPQVQILFTPESWERFKREVAADGRRSRIQLASVLPPSPQPPD